MLLDPCLLTVSMMASHSYKQNRKNCLQLVLVILYRVQPGLDLQQHLLGKEEALRAKGLRLMPSVTYICDEIGNGVTFACINSQTVFEVNNIMSGVDICLKACFVFNLHYNVASQSCWNFLQKAVYGITTPYDSKSTKVLQLIADCSRL